MHLLRVHSTTAFGLFCFKCAASSMKTAVAGNLAVISLLRAARVVPSWGLWPWKSFNATRVASVSKVVKTSAGYSPFLEHSGICLGWYLEGEPVRVPSIDAPVSIDQWVPTPQHGPAVACSSTRGAKFDDWNPVPLSSCRHLAVLPETKFNMKAT